MALTDGNGGDMVMPVTPAGYSPPVFTKVLIFRASKTEPVIISAILFSLLRTVLVSNPLSFRINPKSLRIIQC